MSTVETGQLSPAVASEAQDSFVTDLGITTSPLPGNVVIPVPSPTPNGFEAFVEEVANQASNEATLEAVKDSANFDVFFRKPDGKRKKLKGSTDALRFLKNISMYLTESATAVVAEAPKKRGPKPKKASAESTNPLNDNNIAMWFYDDQAHSVLTFLDSLADPEQAFEVDLHLLEGETGRTLEVLTFEECSVLPAGRSLRFDRTDDAEPLMVPLRLSFSRMTRTPE